MAMKRNRPLDFFRYIFMVNICLWHSPFHLFNHGYIAVDFFLILSGFMLFHTCQRYPDLSTIGFIAKKYKQFYPKYLITFIITAIVKWQLFVTDMGGVNYVFDKILIRIDELLLIQSTGFSESGESVVNGPMWYLSVLIWASAMIYAIQRIWKGRKSLFFISLLMFLGYTYILNNNVCWNLERICPENVFIYSRMLRGLSGIGLGYLLGFVLANQSEKVKRIPPVLINFSLLLAILIVYLVEVSETSHDQYILLATMVIIASCVHEKSFVSKWLQLKVFTSLGRVSFDMFLIHIAVIKVYVSFLSFIEMPKILAIILFVVVVTLTGYIFFYCYKYVDKLLTKHESTLV